jgi:hypothetical protein
MKPPPLLSHQISNDTKITTFAAEHRLSTHSAGSAKFQVIITLIQQNMKPLQNATPFLNFSLYILL